ncbi:MAG: periplasmic heavy metal sensor, partial [Marinicaulis sp.]|nr:periplasmic heavy metal sensor [Marinicaulis sp.]
KKLRQEVAALLGAEAWDRAAIETKFDALQTLQRRQQEAFSAAFLDAFETLTPEERQMLRAAADKRRGRHMNHRMRRGERRQPTGDVPPAPKEEE